MSRIKCLYLMAVLLVSRSASAADPVRNMSAIPTTDAMTIDGLANEPIWSKAPRSAGFIERGPVLEGKPPVETSVQVCFDKDNLYVLVRGTLAHGKAKVQTLRRDDRNIFSDDAISVKIDPLRDLRTVYAFATNAAGAQFDSLTLEDGRVYFLSWDGVWEVEGHSTESEFSVEYKIPFYVLGIKAREVGEMGFNVTRIDPNRAADYDWSLIPPPRSPVGASTFGTLSGVSSKGARSVLELIPYATASTDFSKNFSLIPGRQPNIGVGVDLRLQTGPGSYVEGSVLTDFSQVDTDQVLIANDRFPLFYPERRPFFLNGADVFNFGHASTAQLFFSRRFGLDGLASPILGGVKAYGRGSKLSYGLMNVQTLSVWNQEKRVKRPENYSAGRLRYQPVPQVAVGVLALGRQRLSSDVGDALSLGFDLDLKSRDNRFRSYSFVATTWNKKEVKGAKDSPGQAPDAITKTQSGTSLSNRTEFRGLYLRPAMTWIWSSRDFSAPLGFYRRTNAAIHEGEVNMVPRPNFWGLRDVEIRPRIRVTTTPDYQRRLTYQGRLDLALHWKSNWHAGYFFTGTQDRVLNDFEVFGEHQIRAGNYSHRVHSLWLATPRQHGLSGGFNFDTGTRFGGPYRRASAEFNLRLGRHVLATGEYAYVWGRMADTQRRFGVASANGQLVVSAHTRLTFDTLFRMNLTPGSQSIGNQARLRWRFLPGSDLFVVYANQIPLEGATQQSQDHRVTLKINWYNALSLGRAR